MSPTPDRFSLPGDNDRLHMPHEPAKVLDFAPSTLKPHRTEGEQAGQAQPQPTAKPSSPPLAVSEALRRRLMEERIARKTAGLMIVDDRPDAPGQPLVTVRIDGDLPDQEENLMMATHLACEHLKHLRPLKAPADDVGMLAIDLEGHVTATHMNRIADDMELEATSDQWREMIGELESVAEDLRSCAESMCEHHASKFDELADELEEAVGMASCLADEMDFTKDELRCFTDEPALATVADKMRRVAKAMLRDASEMWPATLLERLSKIGPCAHHAIHALFVIAETMERDSKTKKREFNTGNWAVT